MHFGPDHYVPILRWKQAERFALRNLQPTDRKRITPLIEFTPTLFKPKRNQGALAPPLDVERVLERQAKHLLEACGNDAFFLDLRYIAAEVVRSWGTNHALEYLAEMGRRYKLAIVPVTGLSRKDEYQSAVKQVVRRDGRGICLRITPAEILDPAFEDIAHDFLTDLSLDTGSVHLVVDYEAAGPTKPDPKSILENLPSIDSWRTLSVAIGAFPPDLQSFQPGNKKIPRTDYLTWKNTLSQVGRRVRKPSFSDYTIQYGLYKEPPENCNPSVSVRYTLEEEWLIMRGEAKHGSAKSKKSEIRPGREQYNAHAQILCDNEKLFYGETFSWGDAFIRDKSINIKDHGSPEIWLRAGINHHMTVVSRQIAKLRVS